jgi:hypothetical protein
MEASPRPSLPTTGASLWAAQTAALGVLGGAFGAGSAYLSAQPVALFAAAYAANCALVGGGVLGARAALLAALPRDSALRADARPASALAAALVGGAGSALVAGARRAPAGAALFGLVGAGAQHAADAALEWRAAQARAIAEERRARSEQPGGVAPPAATPRALLLPPGAATVKAAAVAAAPPAAPAPVQDPGGVSWAAWLPFYRTSEESERAHLARLRARLFEVELELGMAEPPPADARVVARIAAAAAAAARGEQGGVR